jgi:ribosomal protein S18 acetylase RimI-like enzyme
MSEPPGQHPRHEILRTEFAQRYRRSFPEAGYHVVRRPYGWVQQHESSRHVARVTLDAGAAVEPVEGLLDRVRAEFGAREILVWVEGREADAEWRPRLEALGGEARSAMVVLAHLGEPPDAAPLEGVALERVGADDREALERWARTKLRGFAGGAEPSAAELRAEYDLRRAEGVFSRYWLARCEDAEAGTIAYYTGEDWQVFSLAVLPEHRGCGIARTLLTHAVRESVASGGLSMAINCDPDDWPITWYRRFGFVDEFYRARAYRFRFD